MKTPWEAETEEVTYCCKVVCCKESWAVMEALSSAKKESVTGRGALPTAPAPGARELAGPTAEAATEESGAEESRFAAPGFSPVHSEPLRPKYVLYGL